MADVPEMLEKIESDPDLMDEFADDPQGALRAAGIEISSLKASTSRKASSLKIKTRIKAGPGFWGD